MDNFSYVMVSDDWIPIEYEKVLDEMEEDGDDDMQPCFQFESKIYWLSDFYRCHDNPWGDIDVPSYIHGMHMKNYWDPIYIEIDGSGEGVRIYKKYIKHE